MVFPLSHAVMRLVVNYVRLRHENTRLRSKIRALTNNQELQESTTRLLARENDTLRTKVITLSRFPKAQ